MPQIAYYLGHPASFWIAVMSRHAGATAANAPAATSPARQRPVVPTAPAGEGHGSHREAEACVPSRPSTSIRPESRSGGPDLDASDPHHQGGPP